MFERAILVSALAVVVGTLAAAAPQRCEQRPVLGEPCAPRVRCSDEAPWPAHHGPVATAPATFKPMRWVPFEKQPQT